MYVNGVEIEVKVYWSGFILKVVRSTNYIGKSNNDMDKLFKGNIAFFRIFATILDQS